MSKLKNTKLKEKPKRQPDTDYRALSFLLILAVAVVAILGIITSVFLPFVNNLGDPVQEVILVQSESITVPFNKIEPIYSTYAYSDTVQLIIEGTGQAGGKHYSDAFYLYAHEDGSPYEPPLLEHFDLEIDGQGAIYSLNRLDNPPKYDDTHRYSVEYFVGDLSRPIRFRISDSIVDDNSGEFRITIYQLPS